MKGYLQLKLKSALRFNIAMGLFSIVVLLVLIKTV